MGKQYKKAPVPSEVRKQWLRRHEENGEPLIHIAKTDDYDIRTVKKIIAEELDERTRKEAHTMVVRNAIEHHYRDLCVFVQRLDDELIGDENTIPAHLRENLMYGALKEHLPRSPIWRNLDRWDTLVGKVHQVEEEVKILARAYLEKKSSVGFMEHDQHIGLNPGIVDSVAFNMKASVKGFRFLLDKDNLKLSPVGEGLQSVQVGAYGIGVIPDEHVPSVNKTVLQLLEQAIGWDQQSEIVRWFAELDQVRQTLRDEFAVIMLRRIVSGRCKYCP